MIELWTRQYLLVRMLFVEVGMMCYQDQKPMESPVRKPQRMRNIGIESRSMSVMNQLARRDW